MRILLIALAVFIALVSLGCERRTITDATITATVKGKLAADAETSALNINVDTNGGVVTLTGTAQTQAGKAQAERIARDTEGVTRVVNNIIVSQDSAGVTASDLTILSRIKARYVTEGITGADIDVRDGVVTLTGEVESAQERARAGNIARAMEGVKSVNNRLDIKQQ